MSCVQAPKTILNSSDRIARSFWWGHDYHKRGLHLCRWEQLCRPMHLGGLGIRQSKYMNDALVAMQAWHILANPRVHAANPSCEILHEAKLYGGIILSRNIVVMGNSVLSAQLPSPTSDKPEIRSPPRSPPSHPARLPTTRLTIALHHPCHASHKASATPSLHSNFTAPLHCIRQLGMGYQSRDSHNTGEETGDNINELMGNQMMKMEAAIINEMAKQRLEVGGGCEKMMKANSASGMAVNDECKTKFLELKAKRHYRFIVFKIEENLQQIVVEKVGAPKDSYEKLCSSLPSDECRYAVYDFDFTTDENCQKSKIFFIAWSPDTSRVRSKMLYASSKDRFRRELDGVQVELQATDPSEMSFDIVKERAF
ncbi:hypothetical protein J1N35_008925 [Gossypium stocksii]|uniref:ADF-H domain-containing protein n=1 Tax=Gossypium stocksii TaxID=47602 RepID=A0A9D3WAD6_9ROSI|nr:hypothetical protein J1N35_008925 [Gossypium stocksii]